MRMHVRIYWPNGMDEVRVVECEPGNINHIHRIVDPVTTRLLEHVNVFWPFWTDTKAEYLDAFVHEEGHIIGLPVNRAATAIYHNNVRVHAPKEYEPRTMPWIVGPMVLFEKKVWI